MYEFSGITYLRVPYQSVVYDIPPRSNVADEWIAVGPRQTDEHELSSCPPTLPDRYGKPRLMKGVIDIRASQAELNLMVATGTSKGMIDQPYRFNGTWSLVRMKGQPPAKSAWEHCALGAR